MHADHEMPPEPGLPAGTGRDPHDHAEMAGMATAAHGGGHGGDPAAHDKHAGHSVAMFRDKFWLSPAAPPPVRP